MTLTPSSTRPEPTAEDEVIRHDQGRPSKPPIADRLLSYVILAAGLVTFFVGAYQIITSHSPVPKWDEWQEIHSIASAPDHHPPISWLWSQHNEHRLPFYRLLLLADVHFFHGNHWIMFAGILAVQTSFLILLAWLLWRGGLSGATWGSGLGLAAFCLFCPTQWENFTWGLQILFFLSPLLFTSALAALLRYAYTPRESPRQWTWMWLALSILAAGAATYSVGNGVAVWPIVILAALVLPLSLRVAGLYVVAACLFVGSYLYHYISPNPDLSPLVSIRHPLSLLKFIAAYLGVILPPWLGMRNAIAIATGCLGLLAAAGMVIWLVRHRESRKPLPMLLAGLMLFSVATAFITALARVGLGLDAAFASRYQTFNLLFWFSIAVFWLLVLESLSPRWRTSLLAVIAAIMLLATTQFPLPLRAGRLLNRRSEAASTALLSGVGDRKALSLLNVDPDMVWGDAGYFRQQHLFMFSDWWRGNMGEPVTEAYGVGPSEACTGEITRLEPVPAEDLIAGNSSQALRIAGWAADSAGEAVRKLLIVADGRIIGYAIGGLQLETKGSKTFLKKSRFVEWSGSARLPAKNARLEVYAISRSNMLCPLSSWPVGAH